MQGQQNHNIKLVIIIQTLYRHSRTLKLYQHMPILPVCPFRRDAARIFPVFFLLGVDCATWPITVSTKENAVFFVDDAIHAEIMNKYVLSWRAHLNKTDFFRFPTLLERSDLYGTSQPTGCLRLRYPTAKHNRNLLEDTCKIVRNSCQLSFPVGSLHKWSLLTVGF